MSHPLRRFAALFALLALSLSAVEKGWATACVETGSSSFTALVETGSPHAQHFAPPEPGDDGRTGDSDPRPLSCPMATASGMSCGVVAVVVPTPSAVVAVNISTESRPGSDHPVGGGALSSLFRPPQQ